MFCEKCGKELEDGSKFCDGCGEAVVVETIEDENVEEIIVEKEEKIVEPVKPSQPAPAPSPVVEKTEIKKEVYVKPEKTLTLSLTKPLGIFSYIWMFILMGIPLVNIIMILVWAFGKNKNLNKKNYAWAVIILILLSGIAWLLIGVIFVGQLDSIIDPIREFIEDTF